MSIADWFRPKWKNSDPAVRLAAVAQVTDQSVLADIAKNAEDYLVREAAAERVTDQSVLADIAKNAENTKKMRSRAVERVTEQVLLADIAKKNDKDWQMRLAVVERVTDQGVLADIAKAHRELGNEECSPRDDSSGPGHLLVAAVHARAGIQLCRRRRVPLQSPVQAGHGRSAIAVSDPSPIGRRAAPPARNKTERDHNRE